MNAYIYTVNRYSYSLNNYVIVSNIIVNIKL